MHKNFFIKLRNWEYWPFGIVQFPAIIYFVWLSIRARSLFFFSGSNPGIPMGGMLGESKFRILEKIPHQFTPKSVLVNIPTTAEIVLKKLLENQFKFPVIFKPDLGERGFMVKRISNEEEVQKYINKVRVDFIVQELIDLPLEFGVFYKRLPHEEAGTVTSVVKKEMLTVTGDGHSTLQQLILKNDRAKLQWNALNTIYKSKLDNILLAGEAFELVSIGNHCLGTKFLDGGDLINEKLCTVFDSISNRIDGFFYGRFDLRCASTQDLYLGKVKIMELNGCGAEPAHIYQPGFPLCKAVGVLVNHWHNIFLIARENKKRGVEYITLRDAYRYYKAFKTALQ